MRRPVKAAVLAVSLVLGFAGWRGLNILMFSPESLSAASLKGDQAMVPNKVRKTKEEWREILSPEAFRIMIECGTEPPFSGRYDDFWEEGTYACAACGEVLFSSRTKYEHGTGWPSFTAPVQPKVLVYHDDLSHGMRRIEVRCASCGAHLGHVFDDGPAPSGKHYCINSVAMTFAPKSELQASSAPASEKTSPKPGEAVFAAGCFWGVEDKFSRIPGVLETAVGYSGGTAANPTYEQVCSGFTGHAESVRVVYDPARVSYEDLVRAFFNFHNPTHLNRQGLDFGTQYRSVIFTANDEQRRTAERVRDEIAREKVFKKKIVTEIREAAEFYRAEEYHQKYYQKNKKGACAL